MAATAAVWNSKKPHRSHSKTKVKLKKGPFISCIKANVTFMWSVLNSVCRFFGVFEIGLKNLKSSWLEKAPGLQLNLNKQSNKTHIVGLNLKEKPFLIQYWIEIGQLYFKAHESAQFPEKMRAVLSGTHYLSWGEFFLSCFHWSRIQLFS